MMLSFFFSFLFLLIKEYIYDVIVKKKSIIFAVAIVSKNEMIAIKAATAVAVRNSNKKMKLF